MISSPLNGRNLMKMEVTSEDIILPDDLDEESISNRRITVSDYPAYNLGRFFEPRSQENVSMFPKKSSVNPYPSSDKKKRFFFSRRWLNLSLLGMPIRKVSIRLTQVRNFLLSLLLIILLLLLLPNHV